MVAQDVLFRCLGIVSAAWYDSYLPALAAVVDANICSEGAKIRELTESLKTAFCDALSDPTYGAAWRRGQGGGKPERDPDFCYNFIARKPCQS